MNRRSVIREGIFFASVPQMRLPCNLGRVARLWCAKSKTERVWQTDTGLAEASTGGSSPARDLAERPDRRHEFSISLCMIVKNESRLIADCLRSARGICKQLVVVDTGSDDDTAAIAAAEGRGGLPPLAGPLLDGAEYLAGIRRKLDSHFGRGRGTPPRHPLKPLSGHLNAVSIQRSNSRL